jgi:myo-inositol catabolism protein IolC
MNVGYDKDLYLLAFDHRGSFQKQLFGISGTPTAEETARISDAKNLIFEGFLEARKRSKLGDAAGVLVDEQFGAMIARRARDLGIVLAMPVEASGRDEFEFEYGADFGKHIEEFNPTFAKVLVRSNPDWEASINARQAAKLKELADWLHARKRLFLFELLVPATKEQLAKVSGNGDRYDREVRPELVVRSIAAMQEAGVEADVWKIEGLDARADCQRVATQARAGGRERVSCIVLGRGAGTERVNQWLKAGAGVPGYRGLAIGRTLWWDPLCGFRDGKLGRAAAASQIADNYLSAIAVYQKGP